MNIKDRAVEHYKTLLSQHDKYYAYSDDGSVYRKGHAEYQVLVSIQKLIDVDKVIWNAYFKENT
jgi:hypothetical protein